MERNHASPGRLSTDAARTAVLALLIEAREAAPAGPRGPGLDTLLAGAGLSSSEIGHVTGRPADVVDARLREQREGPALWRTLQRRRAGPAGTGAAR